MGCTSSQEAGPDQANSLALENELLDQRLRELYTFKVLLLGAGESGKSTIIKQMRLIHNKKLEKSELKVVGDSLHQNVIDCMRALTRAAETFGYPLTTEEHEIAAAVDQYAEGERITPDFGHKILQLFNGDGVQKAYKRRSEFWLLDACPYYMQHLERFTDPNFEPTEEDAVMARVRTTGIVETVLEEKRADVQDGEPGTLTYMVVDVGGQRNERKKWIHCFDSVKCIMFVVNLGGYNQVLFEDASKNRMLEAVELFRSVVENPLFRDTPIVLFLNKKDLFEQMIRETDLSVLFPDYTGGPDVHLALERIREEFRKALPKNKTVNIHEVTGVMKRDVRYAFDEVKKLLLDVNAQRMEAERKQIQKDRAALANGK